MNESLQRPIRRRPALALFLPLPFVLAFTPSCMPSEIPGDPVGTYSVTGQLEYNSCGSTAVPAVDPLEFVVQILDDDGAGVWALSNKPYVHGRLTSRGDFSFKTGTSYALEPKQVRGATTDEEEIARLLSPDREELTAAPAPCVLEQIETVRGTIFRRAETEESDASVEDDETYEDDGEVPDLEAENLIEIRPAAGCSCAGATSSSGGTFLALPCEIRYTLQGELQ